MKSLYLYCIRAVCQDSLQSKNIVGAIDSSTVFSLSHENLEAVVSEIDLKNMSEADIAEKAQEDVHWITSEAKKHQNVLWEAMKFGGVIPMHFGTIFKSKNSLIAMLKERYAEFSNMLQDIGNKEEWSVKIYVREKQFIENIKNKNKSEGSLGDDYFEEIAIAEKSSETIANELDIASKYFFDTLKKKSSRSKTNRPLNKDMLKQLGIQDEEDIEMILNSAYLVEPNKIKIFTDTIERLQMENPEFIFKYTGPWAPFNFV